MPGEEVSSDVDSSDVGFFTKLFGGFAVKSLDSNSDATDGDFIEDIGNGDSTESDSGDEDSEVIEEDVSSQDNTNPVDFDFDVKYQDSSFTTINVTNVDYLWYALDIKNDESFDIKCNINHYVNDELKSDGSIITLEAGNSRVINMRELSSDTVNTISRVKLEISCSDGGDSNTKNDKVKHLKFYFNNFFKNKFF